MRKITKLLAGVAGLSAIAAAAPAAAQYYSGSQYGYSQPYSYSQPYGYSSQYGYSQPNGYATQYGYQAPYGYNGYAGTNGYAVNAGVSQQQCTAAVQNRLYNRTSLGSILGSLVGVQLANRGQVLGITSTTQTRSGMIRIRGIASSGRYAANNYSPYGVGAYGAVGYGTSAAADLSFTCDVDYSGNLRRVDINRRY